MRRLCCAVLLAVGVGGCAQLKALVFPSPAPPQSSPTRREPPSAPVLSPQVGQEEEERLRQEARARIERAEQVVRQIDQKKLAQEQRENFLTVQSFLSKANEALSMKDFPRAFNLADKARVLAEELLSTLRYR